MEKVSADSFLIIKQIQAIYREEGKLKELSSEERLVQRQVVVKEIMDRLNCKELWVSRYGVREGYLCKNFLMTGSTQEVTK